MNAQLHTKTIAQNSEVVRNRATDFTALLQTLEGWLAKLPGRVAAEVRRDDFAIGLHRRGQHWKLEYTTPALGMSEWKPLAEASLKIKIASVDMAEDLLLAIQKEQVDLIGELALAHKKLELLIDDVAAITAGAKA